MSWIGIIAVISFLIFFWSISSGLAHFVCYLIEENKDEYKKGIKKNLIIATISYVIFYMLALIFMNSYKF